MKNHQHYRTKQSEFEQKVIRTLKGGQEYKPIMLAIAFVAFWAVYLMPVPASLTDILTMQNPPGYPAGENTTILGTMAETFDEPALTVAEGARKVKLALAILVVAIILWGTLALPMGATGLLLAGIMYAFRLMPVGLIAQSYMKDAVFFIIGALSLAVGIHKTGLDRRIGLIFLSITNSRLTFLFFFGPLIAITSMFISAKCLIAFLLPVLIRFYKHVCSLHTVKRHPALAQFLILTIVYMTAMGGPGAPTVGARNALMIDFFRTMGKPMTFLQWMYYGFWFVPLGALAVGVYLYLLFRNKISFPIKPADWMREEAKLLGRFRGKQVIMAGILCAVITMWVLFDRQLRLGGPILIGTVLMFLTGVITWEELEKNVSWGVIWMYAGACSIGYVLQITGGALWLATTGFSLLPESMKYSEGLLVSVSILTTVVTNFMSDGAAVAVIGPVTLPMHEFAGLDVWQIGLATAFSSSFAHCLIIGRPGLAIAYALSIDPETRERLLNIRQLFFYGLGLVAISWFVLWIGTFFGYWRLLRF